MIFDFCPMGSLIPSGMCRRGKCLHCVKGESPKKDIILVPNIPSVLFNKREGKELEEYDATVFNLRLINKSGPSYDERHKDRRKKSRNKMDHRFKSRSLSLRKRTRNHHALPLRYNTDGKQENVKYITVSCGLTLPHLLAVPPSQL